MWDLWWTKWRLGRFSPSTSVSPAIFIPQIFPQSPSPIIWGWYNRPVLFFYLVCEAIGTAATPGLLCQPRMIVKMIMETQMECRLARETEVLGENLPQRHFCPSQNPTWSEPGWNPGRRRNRPVSGCSTQSPTAQIKKNYPLELWRVQSGIAC
jgi:hypothetical protein